VDAITLLAEDHRRIDALFDAVSNGDVAVVPHVCEALLVHSRMEEEVLYPTMSRLLGDDEWDVSSALEDHVIMRRLVAELSDESSISPSYLAQVSILMRLVRDHVREEEEILFPRIEAAASPGMLEEMAAELQRARSSRPTATGEIQQDRGASSDGDASWADSPLTQDPQVDRTADAVIRRTQGV
jgi:hemerythrin superfamily protein